VAPAPFPSIQGQAGNPGLDHLHPSSPEGPFVSPPKENALCEGRERRWKVDRSAVVLAMNAGGNLLGQRWLANLGVEGILDAARSRTRLEDFGNPPILDPLRRLLKSADTEAQLNLMGLSPRSTTWSDSSPTA
jgi:hypothetical protein